MHKSERLRIAAEALYERLLAAGVDVVFHDKNERPGVMFADLELIGIPHRLVISDRGLDAGTVEYKARTDESAQDLPLEDAVQLVLGRLAAG
jgi:prolyl-tRNA synthetase